MKEKRNLIVAILALVSSVLSAAIIVTCILAPGAGKKVDKKPLPEAAVVQLSAEQAKKEMQPAATKATAATQPKTEAKTEPKTEAKTEPKTEPATKAAAKPAAKASNAAEAVMQAARQALEKCTDSSMSKEEKLKAAFTYLQKHYLEGVRRDNYRELDWPVVYATDLLIKGKGDCFSYGAAFAYMAKIIGYENVYACNSGGHGWAEIDGKIYDPEWAMHSKNNSYFGLSYDTPCDVAYKGAIGWADWTHVKV